MKSLILITFTFLSCNSYENSSGYFDLIPQNDLELPNPQPGEWRNVHNEPHQSFDDYKRLNPIKAELGKTKIYLFALGSFSETQTKILQLTKQYIEVFFQLKTEFLNPVSDKTIPDSAKRINGFTNELQLYTPYIFDNLLKGKTPTDGYALMAISEKDLYPSPDWNFVFGIASYKDRIGVSSISRYSSYNLGELNFTLLLKRIIATASHEICHMFSLSHCLHAKCSMNGSNNLAESDRQPLRLCSECQRKLNWTINYNSKKRLKELLDYCKDNNLEEDLVDLEKDNKSLK